MCGILIAFDPRGLDNVNLDKMLALLNHRGPDARGIVWRENQNLYMGHARLKIIDSSNGANQPFASCCGRWTLVFNGEIFNYLEIKSKIGDRWRWRTKSDSEVLLAAWALWGERCLDMLVGMFAFAIHDAQERTLTLVRDRFGIKPLYRVTKGLRSIFASEIVSLLPALGRVEADRAAVRTYLECGLYDHSEHTFFEGVRSLKPGSLVRIRLEDGVEECVNWYRFSERVECLARYDEQELLLQAEELVMQAISSHLIADVPVGLNVSGGVDSSVLVRSTLAQFGHAHLFTQDYPGYSELPWVKEIADGGTLNVERLDSHRIKDYLASSIYSQAEPFGGVFVCGYSALYEAARKKNVIVLLDGNGVDESFLGYKRYHQIYVQSAETSAERESRAAQFREFWQEIPGEIAAGASIDGTVGLRPTALAADLKDAQVLTIPKNVGFEDPVRRAAAEDLLYAKIPRGLRFNDRVSMAHSCELRVPYLDHRLVEFAFGIPVPMLLNNKGSKAIFRQIASRFVPASVAYARKRSVQSPQREWLAEEWRNYVISILQSKSFAERGWVDGKLAQAHYAAFLAGERHNSFFIWQWMNLELWARKFLD